MVKMAKMTIFRHGRQGSPRVAIGRQGFPRSKGDPRDGRDELEPNRSYLSHFTTWYSKSGHFPIENPIKNENWPLTPSYGSIILKIVLWAHFTNSHAVLRGSSDILKNPYFGTGYCAGHGVQGQWVQCTWLKCSHWLIGKLMCSWLLHQCTIAYFTIV